MLFLVLDCETTGTDHATDGVVEVGAVLSDERTTLAYDSMLNNPGVPIRPEASAVHHLVDEDVCHAEDLDSTMEDVVSVVMQGQKSYQVDAYVAHNAPFDRGFLGRHLSAVPWLDTLRMARRYLPDLAAHGNQYLRYALKLPVERSEDPTMAPHRALGDALVTAALLRHLLAGPAKEDFERLGVAGFVAHVEAPMLVQVVNFGKHRGKKWSDVPRDYLAWFLRNGEGADLDVLHTVRHWLTQ